MNIKNKLIKLIAFLGALQSCDPAFATGEFQIQQNSLLLGQTRSTNKNFYINTGSLTPPAIRWNSSTSKWTYSHLGTTFKTFGLVTDLDSTGGTVGQVPIADGAGATAWGSNGANQSYEISNVGFTASVAANALTIALKQSDASTDCASTSLCKIGMRSSTTNSGLYNQRTVTAALSIVIPSGTTIGTVSAAAEYIYVYAIDNAGTIELAVSLNGNFDLGSTITTTAVSGGSSRIVLYSTTARSTVPVRLLGRIKATETTAGTWASAVTEISPSPFYNGQVFSDSLTAEKFLRATVAQTGTSTCSITSQGGSWISSVSCSATGVVAVVFSSTAFSSAPSCTLTGAQGIHFYSVVPSTSGFTYTAQNSGGSASNDTALNIICGGPK